MAASAGLHFNLAASLGSAPLTPFGAFGNSFAAAVAPFGVSSRFNGGVGNGRRGRHGGGSGCGRTGGLPSRRPAAPTAATATTGDSNDPSAYDDAQSDRAAEIEK